MKIEDCTVEENVQIAKDTYKMKIKGNLLKCNLIIFDLYRKLRKLIGEIL